MCVIIHQEKGQHLEKEDAAKLWAHNPDGGGFAFVDDDNEIRVKKYMKWTEFWRNFETSRSLFPNRDFLIHMRIATHGSVHLGNVHPFVVDEHTVMAHNGIIHGVTPFLDKDSDESDTAYFVENVLPRMPDRWLDDVFLADMVDEYVGWSRLMFLTTDPELEYTVYRFGDWEKHNGIYMSNTNGLVAKKTKTTYSSDRSWQWESWTEREDTTSKVESQPMLPAPRVKDDVLDNLKELRVDEGNFHDLIVIDPNPQFLLIMCDRCSYDVNLDTGECGCLDAICPTHRDFLMVCPKGCLSVGEDITGNANLDELELA
jgi:hypothetical protein